MHEGQKNFAGRHISEIFLMFCVQLYLMTQICVDRTSGKSIRNLYFTLQIWTLYGARIVFCNYGHKRAIHHDKPFSKKCSETNWRLDRTRGCSLFFWYSWYRNWKCFFEWRNVPKKNKIYIQFHQKLHSKIHVMWFCRVHRLMSVY